MSLVTSSTPSIDSYVDITITPSVLETLDVQQTIVAQNTLFTSSINETSSLLPEISTYQGAAPQVAVGFVALAIAALI
ncbi:hypothetical protein KGF56_004178 [Candida oxycetoniae]|uniref:Uncharacterized protein n=1 Tax=Candida oxycetoniae TaxID=497107 RepID=A0AAI9STT9_9ASCO|nr:uncharacterized protein KGF56_004178 [Candida oxycetoniae]KAI3402926.2 hypothetical protein KGF56_004178 [Candida oxycetoniae]